MTHLRSLTLLLLGAALLNGPLLAAKPGAVSQGETVTRRAENILETSEIVGGLVVVVGCEDPGLLVDLATRQGFLAHGLETSAGRVQAAVAELKERGLLGRASVDRFDGGALPYIDNLVNLLVIATSDHGIVETEIQRVLAPGGVALVDGKRIVKEMPPDVDEWTHHMYDASGIGAGRDTAVSRPRSIQWKAGPEYSRSHENMSSVSAVVSAGGRVFSIMDEGPAASIYLPAKWFLTARDAFSGVQLWKVPIGEWHARLFPLKSGPQQLPRRLVATGDRVYVTLGIDAPVSELDAATGRILRSFPDTAHAEELLYSNGNLLVVVNTDSAAEPFRGLTPDQRRGVAIDEKAVNMRGNRSIVMVDTETGGTVWKTPAAGIVPLTTATDGRRAFFLRGVELVSLDLRSGKEIWTETVADKEVRFTTASSPTLLVHKDVVYVAMHEKLTARTAASGDTMWSAPCAAGGYQAPASIFVLNDLVWDVAAGGEPYRPGSDPNKINRYYIGYDLRTGETVREIPVSGEQGYAIMHHRCHIPRASGNSIITSFPGIEFFDVESGESTHDSWLRGACLYGFMPANGLIYTPPHPCACYTQGKLTGFWAVAGKRNRPGFESPFARLEKGPAFKKMRNAIWKFLNSSAWPTYRGDAARSGTTSATIPAEVDKSWSAKVGPNPSQCVIAGDKLLVATREDHTVHALDSRSGKQLWQFTAGGRVDSAPTWHQGMVLFGSRDGYVYCLDADTGELVWRFRAAPVEQRCVAYDQIESVWPVHGSVLIENDVLWFCAGRSSFLDGGLFVYRLDPRSGDVLSCTTVDSLGEREEQPPITPTIFARLDMEGAKNDVLSSDGSHVFMRHWAFDRNGDSVEPEIDHLFAPTGFLDTSWFRRTYWIYGRSYISGAQGWARAGNLRPSGRIMCVDDDRLFSFGRDYYPPSPGNRHQMYLMGETEQLFATKKEGHTGPLDGDVGRKKRRSAPEPNPDNLWSIPGDFQVRAMVLAGGGAKKRLFIAGSRGDWVTSQDAYEGKEGSLLRVVSAEDGTTIAESELPGPPVFDGMAAADERLFISLANGTVVCLGVAGR